MTKAKSTTKKPTLVKPAAKRKLPHVGEPVKQRKATHLILVLDNSGSFAHMSHRRDEKARELVEKFMTDGAADGIETYVSVYEFGSNVRQHVAYLDARNYKGYRFGTAGMTDLRGGIHKAITDNLFRVTTPELDMAQIMYVLTDGFENQYRYSEEQIKKLISSLNDEWTVIAMVPKGSAYTMTSLGFSAGNILEWETNQAGLDKGTQSTMRSATSYTTQRSVGVKKQADYFQTDFKKVNAANIDAVAKKMSKKDFYIAQNGETVMEMQPFVEATGGTYVGGNHFYQLIKNETVQPHKELIVMDKKTGYAYRGDGVRQLLNLPNTAVMMTPAFSPAYDVFIQSTASNRKIMPTQKVVCIKEKVTA